MKWRDLFLFVFVHSLCVFRRVWRTPLRYAMAFPVRWPYVRSSAVYAFVVFWHLCVIVRGSEYSVPIQILGPTESGCRVRILTTDLRNFYLTLVLESRRKIENKC